MEASIQRPAGAPDGTVAPRPGPVSSEAAKVRHPEASHDRHAPPSPHRSADRRYARPRAHHVRAYPLAHHRPPPTRWYRPWYTHWWVHPYYRWMAATYVVVTFEYGPYPWQYTWVPPVRAGWVWVPGHWGRWWIPGYWEPVGPAPAAWGGHWVYVPGWWVGGTYFEGYWRRDSRGPDWVWVDGEWTEEGVYRWGYWAPVGTAPSGYVWEKGYWDGEDWVEGFWRPEYRPDYRWVGAWFDDAGVYHGGYWEPIQDQPGKTWIPGWFDGRSWNDGYWVDDAVYQSNDPSAWTPPEGVDDGWDAPSEEPEEEQPLALPVNP